MKIIYILVSILVVSNITMISTLATEYETWSKELQNGISSPLTGAVTNACLMVDKNGIYVPKDSLISFITDPRSGNLIDTIPIQYKTEILNNKSIEKIEIKESTDNDGVTRGQYKKIGNETFQIDERTVVFAQDKAGLPYYLEIIKTLPQGKNEGQYVKIAASLYTPPLVVREFNLVWEKFRTSANYWSKTWELILQHNVPQKIKEAWSKDIEKIKDSPPNSFQLTFYGGADQYFPYFASSEGMWTNQSSNYACGKYVLGIKDKGFYIIKSDDVITAQYFFRIAGKLKDISFNLQQQTLEKL